MVDIFDEVSEDLRTERAIKLAQRYGGLLVLVMILVLIAVGGQQAWGWYQAQQNTKAATAYLALVTPIDAANGNLTNAQREADAQSLTRFAASAPTGYAALANLRAAGLYSDAGQTTQANALWNSLADDTSVDPLLRDMANLLWAQHALGNAPDADVLARLKPLDGGTEPLSRAGAGSPGAALPARRQHRSGESIALATCLGPRSAGRCTQPGRRTARKIKRMIKTMMRRRTATTLMLGLLASCSHPQA